MTLTSIKSRRRLLAGGLAAALVAATGLPAQSLGRRGGRLTAGLTPDGFAIARAGATGQTLTEISGDGSLIPALAASWEASPDGRNWRIGLRHEMPGLTELLLPFGDVEVTGETLRLTLDTPDPDLPFRLAAPDLTVPGEAGLYRVVGEEASVLRLARNEDHWKAYRAGWADEITLVQIGRPAARLAALRQARVDVIDGLDAHALRMLKANTEVTLTGDLAVSDRVGLPAAIGTLWPLDNGRMAERWWVG